MENAVSGSPNSKPVEFILIHEDRSWSTAIVRIPGIEKMWADAEAVAWFNKNIGAPNGVIAVYLWDRNPEAM